MRLGLRKCSVVMLAAALVACGADGSGDTIDADVTIVDADPNAADAVATTPDADPNAPDAVPVPDASPPPDADPNAPDADPNQPDARPPPPDADTSVLAGWCSSQPSNFSFFITSFSALWKLSGSNESDLNAGFGGNFGGLAGADNICQTIGAATGHGGKTWRAFLSATNDGSGNVANAIERIGTGPWYDANGRQVATGVSGLLSGDRPDGDPQSTSDLPDECGVPLSVLGDAHDVVTASNSLGMLNSTNPSSTCNDWTSDSGSVGNGTTEERVMCGHSFPRAGPTGNKWLSDHPLRGCGKGALLDNIGTGAGTCIGCTGGYGALYCFAL